MELIRGDLLNDGKIQELFVEFQKGDPYKHLFIDGFLDEGKARALLGALKRQIFEHKESDLFSLSQTKDFAFVKNKILKEFYEFMRSMEFGKLVERVTGMQLKMGTIDLNGSLYESGNYLLCHDDQLEGRKIAFIYYLSGGFSEKDGGCLVMWEKSKDGKKNWKAVRKYLPVWNSFLFFEVSEKSFHEVQEVIGEKKRYAIGGWLY